MTEENKISAEDIIDSWKLSPHMATAIEHLWDASNTSYLATQVKSMEMTIESLKKARDRFKEKDKQNAITSSIKTIKNEISRLRKKMQRGVTTESAEERTKKKIPALEKEIKRVHKATKKNHKADRKVFNAEVGDASTSALVGTLSKSMDRMNAAVAASAPKLAEQAQKVATVLAESAKKAGEKMKEIQKDTAKAKKSASKKNAKKGKKP